MKDRHDLSVHGQRGRILHTEFSNTIAPNIYQIWFLVTNWLKSTASYVGSDHKLFLVVN